MLTRRSRPSEAGARYQPGFTLIEVLVAIVVLSIGLLGLAALQIESLKHNTDAYFRTQATMLAYDIIDRMRANSEEARNGGYVATAAPSTPETCGDSGTCSTKAALANYDLSKWYEKLSSTLPAANTPSSIQMTGTQITVTIRWSERGIPKERSWVIEP